MSTDDPYDAWAGVEFAFPEPDWPPDEDDLRLYLPLVSGGPGLLEGSPETIVRARVGTFARTLRIDIEPADLDPDDPDPDERPAPLPALGPVAKIPLFDPQTAARASHAPEYVLAAALRLMRPGFFGLQAPVDLRGGALRVVAAEPARGGLRGPTSIELDLPAAREELVVALARALRATGHRAGSRRITVDEIAAPGVEGGGPLRGHFWKGRGERVHDSTPDGVEIGAPSAGKKRPQRLSLDEPLALLPPPFEWSVDHEDRSTMTVVIDFERDLDDEARAALTDRSRAFVAMLQLGLLPAAPAEDTPMGTFATSHGCAALSEACDSLPDQWTLALEDFSADLSCVHPFLESLAVLHERWKITDVTLVC